MSTTKPPPSLTELLNPECLQQLQEGLATTAKVTAVIVDPEARPLTAPSNWRGACAVCYDSEPGSSACHAQIRKIVAGCRESGRPVISGCPHGDIAMAAVPIIVDERLLGCWIFGQLATTEPSPETLERAVKRHGIKPCLFHDATAEPLHFPQGALDSLFAIVQTITASMLELGSLNMAMAKRDKELREITHKLEKKDLALTQYVQASPDPMYICDYNTGAILVANRALGAMLHRDPKDILGKNCRLLMGSAIGGFCSLCPHRRLFNKKREPGGSRTREMYSHDHDLWLRITHQAIFWGAGGRAQMVMVKDITHERSMRGQLETLACRDNLTGLPNCNKMAMDFRDAVAMHNAPNSRMICFDLSSLRFFNDAYGKEVGDQMLKTAIEWIQGESFAESGLYCVDSYEFCLLPKRECDLEYVNAVARKIRDRFKKPWTLVVNGREISYVSNCIVSILNIPANIRRFQDLLSLIGRTLNSARKTTKGIYIYDEETDRQNHEHIKLVLALKESIAHEMQGFSVHYQPIVKLSTGVWSGVEALARWTQSGHGPVPPTVFIKEAEALGLIAEIGAWVLDTAVQQIKEIGLDRLEGFFLSVNLSPIQMMDATFVGTVAGILEKHQYPGNKLNLEITESAQIAFSSFTMGTVAQLRAMGVRLALDDFGTGYSSFNSLKNFPASFLKTEREFIIGIENDSYMQYFLFIMSEIAHAAKMKFIAEGIETAEQMVIAKNNGADYIQGYFFSKPATADELREKYERFIIPSSFPLAVTA